MRTGLNAEDLIHAEVVWGGVQPVHVPNRMGTPRADQMQGTEFERLSELAGRVCYDSLGKGRSSTGFHEHIAHVRHFSLYEHCTFTVRVGPKDGAWLAGGEFEIHKVLPSFLNRPCMFVSFEGERSLRVTLNLRHVIEWLEWSASLADYQSVHPWVFPLLSRIVVSIAPTLAEAHRSIIEAADGPLPFLPIGTPKIGVKLVHPTSRHEMWASLLLSGSRGMSHEQVRHGDWTAISQRSTRYVDEDGSPWVTHPLVTRYCHDNDQKKKNILAWVDSVNGGMKQVRDGYRTLVAELEAWLTRRGVDNLSARKQARGAARGYLGNALYTEMIFSASVDQWRRMILARCSNAADAEIRVMYASVLQSLRESSLAEHFADLDLIPASDGIGVVVEMVTAPA